MKKTGEMKNRRDYSLDLLRIVCMLLIVLRHTMRHGGVDEAIMVKTPIWYCESILFVFTTQAVNCLVLISGYFLCTAKFKLSKLISVWGEMVCYSVGVYLVLCALPLTEVTFSIKELVKCGLVFTMDRYWFMTDYLLLYITFPFLNCAINSMDKKIHLKCCMVLSFVFCVLPNIVYIIDFTGINGGYSYTWFCVLYVWASYIRKYVLKQIKYQKWCFLVFALLSLVMCGERFLAYYITPIICGRVVLTSLFYSYNSIISLSCALALFQGFRGLEIRSPKLTKIIAFFAPLTFAVYLIHEQDILRPILWRWIDLPSKANSPIVFLYMLFWTGVIFVSCCLTEYIRKKFFKICKITDVVQSVCDRIQKKANVLVDKLVLNL